MEILAKGEVAMKRKFRGLLVENDVPLCKDLAGLVADGLEACGLDVEMNYCESLKEARALLGRNSYDFLLTDMMFPQIGVPAGEESAHPQVPTGFDILKAAKRAGVPCLSAYTTTGEPRFQELRTMIIEEGAALYSRGDLIVPVQFSRYPEIARRIVEATVTKGSVKEVGGVSNSQVAVIHGANDRARVAMFAFLRSIGLPPIDFETAVKATGKGSPTIPEVLDQLFNLATAVVILETPDEVVYLHPVVSAQRGGDDEAGHQARPNVYFEAGMAFARYPERTILVRLGRVRPVSDLAMHWVAMDDTPEKRDALAARLEAAGCSVVRSADMYSSGEFEKAIAGIA